MRQPQVTVASVPQTEGVATKKTAAKPNKKLIVHPKPTTTVVKQLYGTAFRCGEPECCIG